jgi:hypothetical protein
LPGHRHNTGRRAVFNRALPRFHFDLLKAPDMKKLTKSGLAAALLAALTWLPMQAHAGLFDDEEARKALLDLRAKVEAMRIEMNARLDTKSDKSSALDLVTQNENTM